MNLEAQKLKQLGNEAYKEKDYATALKNYVKAIELEPNEITYYNNIAAVYFQMENFDKCVKFCEKGCLIGQFYAAQPKFIFKGYERMGRALEEMGELENAKSTFEKAKTFLLFPNPGLLLEKGIKVDVIPNREKCLSEIESAIERCQIKNLYEVVDIPGKGKGCIALEDIEIGTLILKEKPQFILQITAMDVASGRHSYDDHLFSLMDSFLSMKKKDQVEYLTLFNKYSDVSLRWDLYPDWERFSQENEEKWISNSEFHIDRHFILKVICIYYTNSLGTTDGFTGGVGIKSARFNHSCGSDITLAISEMQIRATYKIKKGEEICVNYDSIGMGMKNRNVRQKHFKDWGFTCSCERCQDEEINYDDEIYEKFQKFQAASDYYVKKSMMLVGSDFEKCLNILEKAISCHKEMFDLADNKKAPKSFILTNCLTKWFQAELLRFEAAKYLKSDMAGRRENFGEECKKVAKIALEMVKMIKGNNSKLTMEWKERCENFDNWSKNAPDSYGFDVDDRILQQP